MSGMQACFLCIVSFTVLYIVVPLMLDSHRHASEHLCSSLTIEKPVQNEVARAVLVKNFSSTESTSKPIPIRPSSTTKNPAKLAQIKKVELMKMKHQAVPGDPKASSSKLEERLYIRVFVDGSSNSKVFWLPQNILAGKAFDLLSSHFTLTSANGKVINSNIDLFSHLTSSAEMGVIQDRWDNL